MTTDFNSRLQVLRTFIKISLH